jgi:hypothetical protein
VTMSLLQSSSKTTHLDCCMRSNYRLHSLWMALAQMFVYVIGLRTALSSRTGIQAVHVPVASAVNPSTSLRISLICQARIDVYMCDMDKGLHVTSVRLRIPLRECIHFQHQTQTMHSRNTSHTACATYFYTVLSARHTTVLSHTHCFVPPFIIRVRRESVQ